MAWNTSCQWLRSNKIPLNAIEAKKLFLSINRPLLSNTQTSELAEKDKYNH